MLQKNTEAKNSHTGTSIHTHINISQGRQIYIYIISINYYRTNCKYIHTHAFTYVHPSVCIHTCIYIMIQDVIKDENNYEMGKLT